MWRGDGRTVDRLVQHRRYVVSENGHACRRQAFLKKTIVSLLINSLLELLFYETKKLK